MDLSADNYDPSAQLGDGSCTYSNPGCFADSQATTYGGPGNMNGINPPYNVDDGTCLYYGCTDPTASNYGWAAHGEPIGTNNNSWTVTADGESFGSGHAFHTPCTY